MLFEVASTCKWLIQKDTLAHGIKPTRNVNWGAPPEREREFPGLAIKLIVKLAPYKLVVGSNKLVD